MKIGLKDIRNLAIIGTAGAAGVVATLAVLKAAEGPAAPHERVRVERERVRSVEFNVRTVPVQPRTTRTTRIRLRGGGDASPVVYIDGVRVDEPGRHPGERPTALGELSPEDIAKVDVLKGDKAVELYGREAENGVIVVTTREGGKTDSGEGAEEGR